jgi:hypothetical protein
LGDVFEGAMSMLRRDFSRTSALEKYLVQANVSPREIGPRHLAWTGYTGAMAELQALKRWSDRLTLIGEWLLPLAQYMGAEGGGCYGLRLCYAYLARAAKGLERALGIYQSEARLCALPALPSERPLNQ